MDYSHPANTTLWTTSPPSSESVSEFNIDEWLDVSLIGNDEPGYVAGPGFPMTESQDSYYPWGSHSSLMVSGISTTSITISATFTPNPDNPSWPLADIALLSADSVVFYVNQYTLISISANRFRGLLPIVSEDKTKRICFVQESSNVLNTILHIFYNIANDTTCFSDASTLLMAMDNLPNYGISLKSCLCPSSPLFALLMSQAPLLPFDFYGFAAHHELEDLAVAVSPYTLQQPLWAINEQLAERMGPSYLKRLFSLHLGRRIAFEQALMLAPPLHDLTKSCAFRDHHNMTNSWAEGVKLCLERVAQQGGEIFSEDVRAIFDLTMCDLNCQDCQKTKDEHLNKILMQRSLARRTI